MATRLITAILLSVTLFASAVAGPIPGSDLMGQPTCPLWPPDTALSKHVAQAVGPALKDFGSGNYDAALSAFKSYLEQNPKTWTAEVGAGASLACLDRNKDAVSSLTNVLKDHEDLVGARMFRAWALEKLGKREEAMGDFDILIKSNPDDTWCRAHRGAMALQLMDYGKALADFSALLDLLPDNPFARICKADAQALKGDKAAALETLSALPPDAELPPEILSLKGASLLASGRKEEGFAAAVAAIDASPQTAEVWHNLVRMLRMEFDAKAAETLLTGLIEKHVGQPAAHYERGVIRTLSDWHLRLAVEDFVQAWQLDPDHFTQLFDRLQIDLPSVEGSAGQAEADMWNRHRAALLAEIALRTSRTAWARSSLDSTDGKLIKGGDRAWILMRIEVAERHFKEAVSLLDEHFTEFPMGLTEIEKAEDFHDFCASAEYHDWKFPPKK